MHMLVMTSAFYPMHQHTNLTLTILASFLPSPPFPGCTLGCGSCMHIFIMPPAFVSMPLHTNPAISILAILLSPSFFCVHMILMTLVFVSMPQHANLAMSILAIFLLPSFPHIYIHHIVPFAVWFLYAHPSQWLSTLF